MKAINLSSSGLKNIAQNSFTENDNLILLFGDQEIRMNKIFAQFISPFISQIQLIDPTVNYIDFNQFYTKFSDFKEFSKEIFSSDIISLLREISSGFSIEIDQSQAFKLRFLSIILGNEELFNQINSHFPPDLSSENLDTYIEYIECCYHFSQISQDFDFSSLIEFVSKNFYSINEQNFLKLPRTIQYSIISNPYLQIRSEDSLLDIVIEIIQSDEQTEENVKFLEQIEFTILSEEKMRTFLATFDFNTLTSSLWQKLYQCFFIHFDEKPLRIEKRHSEKKTFDYIENVTDRFDGIFNYLTEKFGGNPDLKNIVKITSSSILNDYLPRNVLESNRRLVFSTTVLVDKVNPWLKFDFLSRRVHPTFYSIRTWGNKKGGYHLKNWVLEASDTDKDNDWIVLDSRNNQTCLDDSYAENTFSISQQINENKFYRFLRIRQTGLNAKGTSQLVMSSIEFFGTII